MRKEPAPWLLTAFAELGVEETPGHDATPRIVEYLAAVKQSADDEIPWCAGFVNWCLNRCGIKGTGYANARSFQSWGYKSEARAPGDIVIMPRGSNVWQGHVAFYVQDIGFNILTIGGNQGNKVCFALVSKSVVLDYRTPIR
jgi:uncharacterized protein (TIGR02594 family)